MLILFLILQQVQIANLKVMKINAPVEQFPYIQIFVSVLNNTGNPVMLSVEDFTIYEDEKQVGNPDTVAPFPSHLTTLSLLLIDVGDKMLPQDIRFVKQALWLLSREISGNEKMGILLFADTLEPLFRPGESIDTLLGIARFDSIHTRLKEKPARILDAVAFASKIIVDYTQNISKDSIISSIVVFSKGQDEGSILSVDSLKKISIYCQIPVFTVGIRETDGLLGQIASVTGGEHISGNTPNELYRAYTRLRLRIRSSMVLKHRLKNLSGDAMPHTIKVMAGGVCGERIFLTPYKPSPIPVGQIIAIFVGFIFVLWLYTSVKRRKRRKSGEYQSELEVEPEQAKQVTESESKIPSPQKSEEKPVPVIDKKAQGITQILPDYIQISIQWYGDARIVKYKNREVIPDSTIKVSFNEPLAVGSAPTNHLVLPGIAPEHFVLTFDYKGFTIKPLVETNINGKEISEERFFKDKGGYMINVGPYLLKFDL